MEDSFVMNLDSQADVVWAENTLYFNCHIEFNQIIQYLLHTQIYLLYPQGYHIVCLCYDTFIIA